MLRAQQFSIETPIRHVSQKDIDLFHDLDDSIVQSALADAKTLRHAGYLFSWLLRTPTFQRAVVETADQKLKMEWALRQRLPFFSGPEGRPLRLSAP